jgi:hypothetical protein
VDPERFFTDPDPTFHLVSDPTLVYSYYKFYLYIPYCKCARMRIMRGYKFYREICFVKRNLYF